MKKECDSKMLFCPNDSKKVQMKVAVNFGGKLRSYCCIACAHDDIGETSGGEDFFARAVREGDVFLLTEWSESRQEPEISREMFGAAGIRND